MGGRLGNRSSKAVWGAVLALAFWWPSAAAAAPGQTGKLDKALEASATTSAEPTAVIIRMKSGSEATVTNKVRRRGGDFQAHDLIHALSVRLTPQEIAEF